MNKEKNKNKAVKIFIICLAVVLSVFVLFPNISEVYGAYSASSYFREINMTFVFGGLWRFRRDSNNKPIIDGGKWLYSPMWRVR